MSAEPVTEVTEVTQYGELWSDGTFTHLSNSIVDYARETFERESYRYGNVPESLRPVFASRRVVTTTETYPPVQIVEVEK